MPESVPVSLPGCSVPDSPALDALLGVGTVGPEGAWKRRVVQASPTGDLEPTVVPSCASSQVDAPADWFEVDRIDAIANTTKVVKVSSPVQRTMNPYVEGSMGQLGSGDHATELSVTVPVEGPGPDPATFSVNLVPDPIVDEGTDCSTGLPQPAVVLLAHAPPEAPLNTVHIAHRAHRLHGRTIHQGLEVSRHG